MKIKQLILETKIILKISTALVFGFLLINLPKKLTGQEYNYRFQQISIDDGLSQCTVQCILQDNKGFMWFGTEDGLNRYDGYKFKIYRHDPENPYSISDNSIWAIYEDSYGELWIGTFNGLNRYIRAKDEFVRYQNDPQNPESLSDNIIWTIFEDSFGNLWIGTDKGGLNLFDRATESFTNYTHDKNNDSSLISNSVISILEDNIGNFWVGTFSGLSRFNREQEKFYHYVNEPDNPNSLKNNEIAVIYEDRSGVLWFGTGDGLVSFDRKKNQFIHHPFNIQTKIKISIQTIYEDHSGLLWLGTDVSGLFIFDKQKGSFIHYENNPDDPSSLSSNDVWSIYKDRSDVLWIGTGFGLSKLNLGAKKFNNYQYKPGYQNCLSDNIVWTILVDHLGFLWIGTDTGGLNKYDRKKNKFTVFKNNPNDPNSIGNNCVLSICEDQNGIIWAGTYGGGLNKYNRKNNIFFKYKYDASDSNSPSSDFIQSIFEDDSGILWIGTEHGVLNKFDQVKKKFTRYPLDTLNTDIPGTNEMWTIHEDKTGCLWIGTERSGLVKFNPKSEKFCYYQYKINDSNSVSSNSILSIYEDKFNKLWLGTSSGLNKFDPIEEKFTHYRKKNGLPNELVYGILAESNSVDSLLDNLWISTNKGLSKFNPNTETFRNYDVWDGLQSNEFNSGAYFKSKNGEMFFGGINGLNSFFPKNIKDNLLPPPIIFTDFKLFYKSASIGKKENERSILSKSITETDFIELTHKENIFSIEFSALDFAVTKKNMYKYKMEGLDQDWNFLGTSNVVSFHQLPPGNYLFKVKGSNSDGVWSTHAAELKISIIPPFWQRSWFKVIFYAAIILMVFLGHQLKTRFIRKRNLQLEEWNSKLNDQIAERKKAENKIAASLKEKEILLKEIHHRVKNNLQVISSLLYLQSKDINDTRASALFKESQSRVRSIALVHEWLYQSENLAQIDFFKYIKNIVNHLIRSYSINQANIKLNLKVKNIKLDIDTAISCGLIITELVTNSLKYAFPDDRKGEVIIRFQSFKDMECELIVGDTGIGFPSDFNLKERKSLGLRLVNELVAQLNGTIDIEVQRGTSFKIKFSAKNKSRGTN